MPIALLPPNTVCSISSSQVLTDSCSLVKELIDNSLDAEAAAVFVEVSLNALDVIQVRDNGHGINPGDRMLVCNRHCTSKIRGLADLESIGGKSLGFRGEALASAAELSGSIVVSTRVEGEATAVSLTIGRKGEIKKEERVSIPKGTTVRILDFLKTLPVRRQTALKSASKSLIKIKRLLQSYALARPSVRFSLKLLKAKNDNGNWIYAPHNVDYIPEAARSILGKDVTEQCQWKLWQPLRADDEAMPIPSTTSSAEESYTIEALLPKPNYDPRVISNIGQFISVDSRPVSCTRGTFKKIVVLYKAYLGSGSLTESSEKPKDPVLCMNIICPRASYDANVEPAKDDVLFTNPDLVLRTLEDFFKEIYGDIKTNTIKTTTTVASNTKPRGFEILLARERQQPTLIPDSLSLCVNSTGEEVCINSRSLVNNLKPKYTASHDSPDSNSELSGLVPDIKAVGSRSHVFRSENHLLRGSIADSRFDNEILPINRKKTQRAKVYADVGPLCDDRRPSHERDLDDEEELRDTRVSNPWTFAKINTPIRQHNHRHTANAQLLTPGYQTEELDEIIDQEVHSVENITKDNRRGLPTPQYTQPFQGLAVASQSSSPEPYPFSSKFPRSGTKSTSSRNRALGHSTGGLDTWVQASPGNGFKISSSNDIGGSQQNHEVLPPKIREFVSARTIPMDTRLELVPRVGANLSLRSSLPKRRMADFNTPFDSPISDPHDVRSEAGSRPTGAQHSHRQRRDCDVGLVATSVSVENREEDYISRSEISSSVSPMHPDLAKTLDYEVRKQAAVLQWRANQRKHLLANDQSQESQCETPSPLITSPHKNRYRRAVAALHLLRDDLENTPVPTLEHSDPRAYLIRTQAREAAEGTPSVSRKRRKTSSLPLETVLEENTVRDLILNIDTENIGFKKIVEESVSKVNPCDKYLISGTIPPAFSFPGLTTDLIQAWEAKLRELVMTSYKPSTSEKNHEAGTAELQIDLWPLLQTHLSTCA